MVRLRLKQVIKDKGFTMAKVSRMADMAYNTVQVLCSDPYHDVNLSTLNRLAEALKVSVHELIEDVPTEEK